MPPQRKRGLSSVRRPGPYVDLHGGSLRVDERTAEEIRQLQAAGNATFSLALRPDQDTRQLDTSGYGETTNKIVQRYEFPIPQVYPTP